jgi:hypothetical protein
MGGRMQATGSTRYVSASGGTVESSKFYLDAGVRYRYSQRIEFRADAGLVNYSDKRTDPIGGKKDYSEKILRLRMIWNI